jgi:molecular chaperone GrpE
VTGTKGKGNGGDDELDDVTAETPDPGGAEEGGLDAVPASAEQELGALRRERDELREALLRRRADFENYKRRVERDQQVAARDAAAEVFRGLLDTVDNLERALSARGGEGGLREGVELTLRDLLAMLEAKGVSAVDPLGERFDPVRHHALLHEPVAGFAAGTVAEVFRKGYTFNDRLLRPALVKVASGEDEEAGSGETGGGADLQ